MLYWQLWKSTSKEAAVQKLIDIQPDSIDRKLLDKLFDKPKVIKTKLLIECLSHRSDLVRLKAVQILQQRSLLMSKLQKLLIDTNAEIRYIGLLSIIKNGEVCADEEAKQILVKVKSPKGISFHRVQNLQMKRGESVWGSIKIRR